MKLSNIFLFCALIGSFSASAVESGKVYRFGNVGKPGTYLALGGAAQSAVGATGNEQDLKQQWYVEANSSNTGYFLRNVANGSYLTSPKTLYTQWPLTFTTSPVEDTMLLTFGTYDGHTTIKALSHNNNYAFAHCDSGNSIVCWLNSSTPSQWTEEEVPMTPSQIEEMLQRFVATGDEIAKASVYEGYLDQLFNDKACSELKVPADNIEANENYRNLPATLQSMVSKIAKGDWSENNGADWEHKYAKKYRLQSYEPYSEGSAAAGLAGIQAYTNMNNPTGIIGNTGDMLYIMVDKDVPEGATLYLGGVPDCSMYNSCTAGTKLKKGLNMVMCNSDLTHYFIYYTVNTVENKSPKRMLSAYPDINIHIEGGQINGFFNYVGDKLYEADTKEDFFYTSQRAKHPMYDLIGKYVILHFYLEDTADVPGGTPQICVKNAFNRDKNPYLVHDDPVITMQAWDKMCFAERILMGIQSDSDILEAVNEGKYESIVNDGYTQGEYVAYPTFQYNDYFNNRMMGINYQGAGLYMNATSWRTAYAPSTISAILSQFPEGGIWGPAHEYGHINQGPISIAGTTEESNNVFSNVANYYVCKTTSRCDYPSEQLKHFSAGDTYLQNETWGTTRMFWQLWCYYHYCEKNKKFYPRLFELLRKYPLVRETTTYNGKLNAKKDMLHFAKMACIAAGEDLTNFFASWGFFSPQDSYHIDDYSIYDMIVTPEDIAEIKQEIKEMGFEPNDAIILIDDRPNSSLATGFGYDKSKCGQYGGLDAFKNGASASGDFTFTVDGNNVSVSGSGNPGVGFLIYDENGNLIGFSNSDNFTLSSEAASALVEGKATVKAVGADNEVVEVKDPVRSGSVENKKELLKTLLDRCDNLLTLSDESLSHIGDLIPSYCTSLKAKRDDVEAIWENSEDTDALTEAYLELSKEYYALLNNSDARISVEPNASYRLINNSYTTKTLDAGDTKLISSSFNASTPSVPFTQQWVLEPVEEGNLTQFYIRNLADGRYVSTTKKQSAEIPLTQTPQVYSFITIEPGVYSFAPDNEVKFGLHIDASNKVVQWNTTSTPTQWKLVKVCSPEQIKLRNQLTDKLAEAESLLSTCGSIERSQPVEYKYSDSHLYSNALHTAAGSDQFKGWNVIFDKDVTTFFHSNYDSSKDTDDGLDPYIRLQAPDNGAYRFLNLSYVTRQNTSTSTNPTSVIIEASSDNKNWRDVYHASGLPTGSAITVETGEICVPADTKYIRFMVPVTGSSLVKGHHFFVVSELAVYDLGEPLFIPDAGFPYLKPEEMQTLYERIVDARLDLAYSATSADDLTGRLTSMESALSDIRTVMVPKVDITAVSFPVDPVILKVDDEPITVMATVEPENATFPEFDWQIADESIACIVSTDGKTALIKPLSRGVTELSVKVVGNPLVGAVASLKVLPQIPVEAVVVSPSELSVPVNAGVMTLKASVLPENATVTDLAWESSDPSIIEIDSQSGLMTLLRQGTAEITARSTDGTDLSAKSVVTVTNPVAEGLLIYPLDAILEVSDHVQFTATYLPEDAVQPLILWSSSDETVAMVDPSGYVTALKAGSAEISASAEVNGKTLSVTAMVTVTPLTLKAITLSTFNLSLEKGESGNLDVVVSPEGVEADLVWETSDESVIALNVAADKLSASVEALKAGMAVVTVYSESNPEINSVCQVTVPEIEVTGVKLQIDDVYIDASMGKKTVSATVAPADASLPRLLWESSDETVAKVEPVSPTEAEINPVGNGDVFITVTHADRPEINDSVEIHVSNASAISLFFDDLDTKVDVFDMAGQIVRHQADLRKLHDLAPGLYLVKQGALNKSLLLR